MNKISEAMKFIGHDDVFKVIASSAGKNEENLKRDIGKFTKRRHIIAHCGDHDLTQSPPAELSITSKEASDCIDLVELIARKIDQLS